VFFGFVFGFCLLVYLCENNERWIVDNPQNIKIFQKFIFSLNNALPLKKEK
jgi:hypothetical protein